MVDAVGSAGSALGGKAVASAAPQTPVASAAAAPAQSSLPPLSPVMTADPLSGAVITEYLNQSGKLEVQVPSTAAVAYMRMGLSKDGTTEANQSSVVA